MHPDSAKADLTSVTMSAISEGPDNLALIVIASFLLALFHRSLRRLYPCLTIVELNNAEVSLDDTFDNAAKNDYLSGSELEVINQSRLRVKNRASEIRSQRLEAPLSIWKKCLNVEVGAAVGFDARQNLRAWSKGRSSGEPENGEPARFDTP